MGSRYGGLKQMDPMGPNGETVLDYSVFDAIRAGFKRVVFVIREDFAEAFREGVGTRFADKIKVDYTNQRLDDLPPGYSIPEGREKPWGTAHAVRAARGVISEPFAVINADDFYGTDAYRVAVDYFLRTPDSTNDVSHYAMVGYALDHTLSDHGDVNRGICQLQDAGRLANVEEVLEIQRDGDGTIFGKGVDGKKLELAHDSIVSMNFWAFTPSFFGQLEKKITAFLEESGNELKSECYIPTVVDSLISDGTADCHVLQTTASWFGVTYPDDKAYVVSSIAKLIELGEYPTPLL
jgi:NDP-sugar pyrophosphorylase family protein